MKKTLKILIIIFASLIFFALLSKLVLAARTPTIVLPKVSIDGQTLKGSKAVALPIKLLMLMTVLTLAPYILIMMTSYIRIAIVLSFVRTSMGTQSEPPNQVLTALALFLTLYVMAPVGIKINKEAIKPFVAGKISQEQFFHRAWSPLRDFMLKQTDKKDIALFFNLAKLKKPKSKSDIQIQVLLPAFMLSEIKKAFEIGFIIYIPFLIIDMIVSSVLMSMGMFMLSPMTISLPFKLLLFVMIDGWTLVVKGVVMSFK